MLALMLFAWLQWLKHLTAIAKLFPFTLQPKAYIRNSNTCTEQILYGTYSNAYTLYTYFCGLNFGIIIYCEFCMNLNEKHSNWKSKTLMLDKMITVITDYIRNVMGKSAKNVRLSKSTKMYTFHVTASLT